MINHIIDAISLKLSKTFIGSEIYTDNPEQGLDEPCFLITVVNPKSTHFLNNRYRRTNLFVIQYFPENGRNEINAVLEQLYLALEHVTDLEGETYRGSEMKAETNDNVLHFFIHYDGFVDKIEEQGDLMEDITINNQTRS